MRTLLMSMRLALVAWSVVGMAHAATVATLDGRQLNGPSIHLASDTVRIGNTTVPLADCDWIEPGSGSGIILGKPAFGVWLVDGSWLPASAIAAAASDHVLRVTSPLGVMEIPLTAIRGWANTADLTGDDKTDRVVLDGGPVTGRIDGIIAGKLQLRSDLSPDKALEFPLDQVRAVRLAVPDAPLSGLALTVTIDPNHPALRLRPGDVPALLAAPTVALPPLSDGALVATRLRVEGGRRVYLSDLTPSEVHDEGAFGVVWPWQRDHNLDGSPLRLGGQRYARGLVAHSKSRLVWSLNGRYVRLKALAGIADLVGSEGDCAVVIAGDGKTLWERGSIKGGETPTALDLDVSGIKQLELRVELGARYDIGDHFVLADAWLIQAR